MGQSCVASSVSGTSQSLPKDPGRCLRGNQWPGHPEIWKQATATATLAGLLLLINGKGDNVEKSAIPPACGYDAAFFRK